MIIICCFMDCLVVIVLVYEVFEVDVLKRFLRWVGVDRLVDWRLIV